MERDEARILARDSLLSPSLLLIPPPPRLGVPSRQKTRPWTRLDQWCHLTRYSCRPPLLHPPLCAACRDRLRPGSLHATRGPSVKHASYHTFASIAMRARRTHTHTRKRTWGQGESDRARQRARRTNAHSNVTSNCWGSDQDSNRCGSPVAHALAPSTRVHCLHFSGSAGPLPVAAHGKT